MEGAQEVTEAGFKLVALETSRGVVEARYRPVEDATSAVLMIGDACGGFDSPAKDLYGTLFHGLPERGLSVMQVKYRHSTAIDEATHDVLAGLAFLQLKGVRHVGLVGYSFGAAVALRAAERSPLVTTVVTLGAQSFGADAAERLGQRPLLFLHGDEDEVHPFECSMELHRLARGPNELRVLKGTGHRLDRAADAVHEQVEGWLLKHLV